MFISKVKPSIVHSILSILYSLYYVYIILNTGTNYCLRRRGGCYTLAKKNFQVLHVCFTPPGVYRISLRVKSNFINLQYYSWPVNWLRTFFLRKWLINGCKRQLGFIIILVKCLILNVVWCCMWCFVRVYRRKIQFNKKEIFFQ